MDIVDKIAEARIQEALEKGQLSNLPGAGEPLKLDDDHMIPEELRAGYRLLKNAGFLPPELQLRKDIAEAEQLLLQVDDRDAAKYACARARLELLRSQLNAQHGYRSDFRVEEEYFQKLLERMG